MSTKKDNLDIMQKMLEMFESFTEKILNQMQTNFTKHTDLLNTELFNLSLKLDKECKNNEDLKKQVDNLNAKNVLLQNTCTALESKMDSYEQKELNNCISLTGELTVKPLAEDVVNCLNLNLPTAKLTVSNILDFHIIKKDQSTTLKVKLDSNATKARVFQSKKLMVTKKLYLNECLTSKKFNLLQEAKKLTKLGTAKFVWSKNGQIFIRVNETSKPIRISSVLDLHSL